MLGTGSGSFTGLTNLSNLGKLNISEDYLNSLLNNQSNDILDTTSQANANYTSDDRNAGFNTKAASTNLDTSQWDAKVQDYQDQIAALQAQQQSELSKLGYGYGLDYHERSKIQKQRDAIINNYSSQISNLQNLLNTNTTERQNYLNDQANRLNLDTSTTQQDQALSSASLNTQAEANANKTANINAGINKSKAGMLGAQNASTDTANTANNLYTSNSSNAAATQADYLSKMNAASALDAEASGADATARNMSKSAGLAGISGALQGASSGAAMGAVVSDEDMKEPVSDEEMNAAYKEFVELYIRLKQLKGEL